MAISYKMVMQVISARGFKANQTKILRSDDTTIERNLKVSIEEVKAYLEDKIEIPKVRDIIREERSRLRIQRVKKGI